MMLSVRSIAHQLNCSPLTVIKAIRRGELLAQKEKGRWIIEAKSIATFRERLERLAAFRKAQSERMRQLWRLRKLLSGKNDSLLLIKRDSVRRRALVAIADCPKCGANLSIIIDQ